jgi:hypothetical protein
VLKHIPFKTCLQIFVISMPGIQAEPGGAVGIAACAKPVFSSLTQIHHQMHGKV